MMGIKGACSKWVGEVVQAIGSVTRSSQSECLHSIDTVSCNSQQQQNEKENKEEEVDDELMMRALTAVFGMEKNGKIKKEKARQVVEKLGLNLIYAEDQDQEVGVEEVLSGLKEMSERQQLLHEAFKIFDEDGNGYIEAAELKRVLQCLGLDKGWDITDIQNMLKVVDLNLDGKIDFSEFELMMG